MSDFLTTKQVIEALNIDRTTLYRMLKDGRLEGVKIGAHWRFSSDEVNRIMSGNEYKTDTLMEIDKEQLPIKCISPIKDVFSEIADIGVVITTNDGTQLSEISNSCEYCNLIRDTQIGKEKCTESWKKLGDLGGQKQEITTCHAGMHYAHAPIIDEKQQIAILVAGQFTVDGKSSNLTESHISEIAKEYEIDEDKLIKVAKNVTVLDERWQNKISLWLGKIAKTFESVIHERKAFMNRLSKITDLSNIHSGTVL